MSTLRSFLFLFLLIKSAYSPAAFLQLSPSRDPIWWSTTPLTHHDLLLLLAKDSLGAVDLSQANRRHVGTTLHYLPIVSAHWANHSFLFVLVAAAMGPTGGRNIHDSRLLLLFGSGHELTIDRQVGRWVALQEFKIPREDFIRQHDLHKRELELRWEILLVWWFQLGKC